MFVPTILRHNFLQKNPFFPQKNLPKSKIEKRFQIFRENALLWYQNQNKHCDLTEKHQRLKIELDLLIVVKVRALRRGRKALGVKRIAAFRTLTAFGR